MFIKICGNIGIKNLFGELTNVIEFDPETKIGKIPVYVNFQKECHTGSFIGQNIKGWKVGDTLPISDETTYVTAEVILPDAVLFEK